MGFFGELGAAFMQGMRQGIAQNTAPPVQDEITSLCAANGWTVDEQTATCSRLHFNTPAGIRKVSVWEDQGAVWFCVLSQARFHPVPQAVMDYMRQRNAQLGIGGWTDQDGYLGLTHRAYGLTGTGFKNVCMALVNEVLDLDAKLRASGLLR